MPAIIAFFLFASPVAPWFAAGLGFIAGLSAMQGRGDGAFVFGTLALTAALYSSFSSATMLRWLEKR